MTGPTFERAAFETRLNEVGDLLGELRAVDEALAAVTDGQGGIEVRVGRRHPFEVHLRAPGVEGTGWPDFTAGREATERFVAGLDDAGRAWAAAVVATVRERVADVVRPLPGELAEAELVLRHDVWEPLRVLVADDFAMLANNLGDWEGQAAEEFADLFYHRVGRCVDNQVLLGQGIGHVLAASKAIVHQGQHSLMGLVEATVQVLDDQLRQRQAAHAATGSSAADWLMLAATIGALVAAVPTGGLSAAAAASGAAGGTGALLQYAASGVEGGDAVTLTARGAPQAADELLSGVTAVRANLDALWAEAADAAAVVQDLGRAADAAGLLHPPCPRLAGPVTPADFRHEGAS